MLVALHGFLGSGKDWEVCKSLENLVALEYTESVQDFCSQAQTINQHLKHSYPGQTFVLLGYSLGGRVGMHLLIQDPLLWKGAVIVSAHPGLKTVEERTLRLKSDRMWAKRFCEEDWETVLRDWNRQSIFQYSQEIPRTEYRDIDRQRWANVLKDWSLGIQENLTIPLSTLSMPILWVVGERDIKFRAVSESLAFFHPLSRVQVIPGAGHRVPWDCTEAFQEAVQSFLKEIIVE